MRDTEYAREITTASDEVGQKIERIFVKPLQREEIRFSWWKDGKLVPRPLDLPEDELLPLFEQAIRKGVFTTHFLSALQAALMASHEPAKAHGLAALLDSWEPTDDVLPDMDDLPPGDRDFP